jgi:uncharacterized protein (TIGR03437 family)
MTYRDLPAKTFPTVNDDVTQVIIDPHTGAQLRKVNTSTNGYNATFYPFLYFGGFSRMCATKPYNGGFLCAFPSGPSVGGPAVMYYVKSDGTSNYLGYITIQPQSGPDGWGYTFSYAYPFIAEDGSLYNIAADNSGRVILMKGTFVGGTQAETGAYQASVQWMNATPGSAGMDINAQMAVFDSTFNPATYKGWPSLSPPSGNYILLNWNRGQQDTSGWSAVMDLTTYKIVAAINLESGSAVSYCGLHNLQVVGGQPLVNLGTHGLWGGSDWQGPFQTSLSAAIDSVTTTIQLAGVPSSPNGETLGGPYVGSILTVGGEPVKVTAINGNNSYSVQRNYIPVLAPWDPGTYQPVGHPAGENVRAQCTDWSYADDVPMYWSFLADPHGTTLAPGKVMYDQWFGVGGHNDWASNLEVVEGWQVRTGALISQIGQPATYNMTNTPTFASAQGGCFGSGCPMHPVYHTPGASWFTDGLPWDGGNYTYPDPQGATPISGMLYKYNFPYNDGNFPSGGQSLHRKVMPTLATTGGTQLIDVSGPGSSISDQATDNYKYCIAYIAGECRTGSNAGDIFANLPTLGKRTCYGGDNPDPSVIDLCVLDLPSYAVSMLQVGFVPNHEGLGVLPGANDNLPTNFVGAGYSRIVTEALGGPKGTGLLFKSLPDGSWAFFENRTGQGYGYLMLAKLPPFTKDSVRRDVFVRAPITITPPSGLGIVGAEIDFGYAESGAVNAYHCTSRNEVCAAVTSTVDDTNPFNYVQSDSYSKAPCSSSCTITLPVLPQHVAYYQVKFYDASGKYVANGARGVIAESTAASLGGLTPTATALQASLNPSTSGSSVKFTATVTGVGGTPTGTVQFYDSSVALGTAALSGGTATLSTSSLAVGTHSITVSYSGDTAFAASTSQPLTETINPTVSLTPTTTTLQASLNPSTSGSSVTFTATVTGTGGTPTGTVTFLDGSGALGTATLSGGTATLSTSSLAAGTHSITVSYSGNTAFSASTSQALTETINPTVSLTPTATALQASLNPSTSGSSVTFTATVTGTGGTPTGTVQFYDGSVALGTATLSGGKATFSTSSLAVGAHGVTVTYSGNTAFAASTSQALTETINPTVSLTPTATALQASLNPSTSGSSVKFTATVTGTGGTPTGTVTFLDGSVSLGTATLSGGKATFSTSSLAVGAHGITVSYSGDSAFSASTSQALAETINSAAAAVPQLIVSIGSSGNGVFAGARNLNINLTNSGTVPAYNAQITAIDSITTISGSGSATLASVLPGPTPGVTLSPSGSVTVPVVLNWPSSVLQLSITFRMTATDSTGTVSYPTKQTIAITQSVTTVSQPPSLVSLSPFQGIGPNATLTLVYADPNTWAAIQSAEFIVNPRWEATQRSGGCYIKYAPGTGLFTLIADDGNSIAGTTLPGSSTNISNSQCTLNAANSSATGSGNNLTLVVSLTFSASFTGQRHIWMQAVDYNNMSSNWLIYGVWFPAATTANTGAWYRLYDPFSKSYLYSFDKNEYDTLVARGFVGQGVSGLVMDSPTTVGGISNLAWYRVFVASTNSHFWTSDRNEFLTLINQQQAYVGEGVAAFVMPYINAQGQVSPQVTNTTPFWRAVYQGPANLHFWTSDPNEYNGTNGKQLPTGYKGEGIACYIFPATGALGVGTSAQFDAGIAAQLADDGGPVVVTAANRASYVSNGVIVPGQALSIYGRHLGGRVLLNGVPAQIIETQDNEIQVVAPHDLAPGTEATLEVEHLGRRSRRVTMTVVASDPAIFGTNQYGKGIAQARNEDGTTHGNDNPAARGSVVTLYTTGVGSSGMPVEVHVGGQPAEVISTLVSGTRPGVTEVQFRVPSTVDPAPFQPVVLHVGNLFSQPGVGLAIR